MVQLPEGLTREHQKVFKRVFRSVSRAGDVFQNDEIWPTECDHAADAMYRMSKLVKDLYDLLDVDNNFSTSSDSLRYDLLIALNNLETLLDEELIPTTQAFRAICRTPSPHVFRQKQRILYEFEKLCYDGKGALNCINMMLDDLVLFRERKKLSSVMA